MNDNVITGIFFVFMIALALSLFIYTGITGDRMDFEKSRDFGEDNREQYF